jgi:hypothetical protein
MPRLFVSDKLPNYFVAFDFSRKNRESGALDHEVLRAFEDGKCIYFENWIVDFDHAFFNRLDLQENRAAKKLRSKLGDDGILDPRQLTAQLDQCAKDDATRDMFPRQAAHIGSQVTPILNRIFKNQQYYDRGVTWRMLETVHEDLHVDVYKHEKSDFQIRMFVNLDIVPRIWHTSHALEGLIEKFGDRLSDEELSSLGPSALIRLLNQRVYGGLANAGQDGQPRHTVYFYPGEVWMVDSRRISHQIFYGRRAVSLDYLASPESMNDPSKYYLRSIENYRSQRGFRSAPQLAA